MSASWCETGDSYIVGAAASTIILHSLSVKKFSVVKIKRRISIKKENERRTEENQRGKLKSKKKSTKGCIEAVVKVIDPKSRMFVTVCLCPTRTPGKINLPPRWKLERNKKKSDFFSERIKWKWNKSNRIIE